MDSGSWRGGAGGEGAIVLVKNWIRLPVGTRGVEEAVEGPVEDEVGSEVDVEVPRGVSEASRASGSWRG